MLLWRNREALATVTAELAPVFEPVIKSACGTAAVILATNDRLAGDTRPTTRSGRRLERSGKTETDVVEAEAERVPVAVGRAEIESSCSKSPRAQRAWTHLRPAKPIHLAAHPCSRRASRPCTTPTQRGYRGFGSDSRVRLDHSAISFSGRRKTSCSNRWRPSASKRALCSSGIWRQPRSSSPSSPVRWPACQRACLQRPAGRQCRTRVQATCGELW
jgi:hypothetical protein